MATGQIKRLVSDRGFGFLQETGATEDVFFHSTSLAAGLFDQLTVGQNVDFEKGADDRDPRRIRAINVRPTVGG